jgi:L-fucose isomerase-like protein
MIVDIGLLGKPMLVANEFLGGCGGFLTRYSALCTRGIPAAAVSSTRLSDLVVVAHQFVGIRETGMTPAVFAQRCEQVYRTTFGPRRKTDFADDPVTLTDISECVERFRKSSFLIVGRGEAGEQRNFLGATARYIDFAELGRFYDKVDMDRAREWAGRWREAAEFVTGPEPEAIDKAGAVYLATLELLNKYNTDTVTMNCLGGFAAGKLPAYPCLGFMQILNHGGQGVCEAKPDDTLSMLMARILTGRPAYVSDPALDTSKNQIVYAHCVATTRPFGTPALDTSKNQIVYAHCVATTRPFGTESKPNSFRILTLHNRDPRGACAQSFLPPGYMTTSFRTNAERKEMIIHQAKAVGNLVSEYGCRTKLVAEVAGDIGKLFDQWDQFGWHRVTVYGDVKEPLAEFAKALGLKVIEEA